MMYKMTVATPPAPTEQGAVESSLFAADDVLDANQINRLGLHVIEDAVVTEAADEIVPNNDDPEDGIGSSSRRHDIIPPEAEEAVVTGVIRSVNCRGKEIRTSTITWSICALLIVIVAIVVPTTVILSGKNTPQEEDDRSPLSTPPMIIDEEEMERQAKLLSIATSLSSPLDLENPSSPQSKALEWLLGPANSRVQFRNVTLTILNVNPETIVPERYVMATLYYSLGGGEWTKKWGVGNSFEESVGPVRLWSRDGLIQTNENGLVTGLFLGDNNLNGTIPPEIQHLQRLQYFHIQENSLVRGNVPMEMEKLSNLTGFWAQDTNIVGEIDFLCDIRERGDNVTTAAAATAVVTNDECESCGFKVDLENVQCSCCECCQ